MYFTAKFPRMDLTLSKLDQYKRCLSSLRPPAIRALERNRVNALLVNKKAFILPTPILRIIVRSVYGCKSNSSDPVRIAKR